MNRVQDHQKLYRVSKLPSTGKWTGVLLRDEPSVDGAWFDKMAPLHVLLRNGTGSTSSYIEMQEDGDGFTHLAYYKNASSAKPTEWLTKGRWEVTEFSAFDSTSETVYFMSTEEGSTQRHLYAINLTNGSKRRVTPLAQGSESTHTAVPYTNLIDGESKNGTGFYSVSFSPRAEWIVVSYQGPDVPWQKIVSTRKGSSFYIIVVWRGLNIYEYIRPCYEHVPKRSTRHAHSKIRLSSGHVHDDSKRRRRRYEC
jgi:hypothetical protein